MSVAGLSLCVVTPLGSNDPFTGVASDHWKTQIFTIMIHNSIKITAKSSNENEVAKKTNVGVGVTTTRGTALKGLSMRKVENL